MRLRQFALPLLAVFLPAGANAQDAIEEVVVTATKRAESIQDIGLSMNAFSGQELAESAIFNSDDVFKRVPNLEFQLNGTSTGANIFLRGMGTSGPAFNQLAGVGVYADEISLNSPIVNIAQLYDLERVEVLRGPQNTLYGRNTTGGAMNLVSRKPDPEDGTNGYASVTAGNYSAIGFEGAFGMPLGENSAFRGALQYQKNDGYSDNRTTGTTDIQTDKIAARLMAMFRPTDNLEILLRAHAEAVDGTNIMWKSIGTRDPANPSGPNTDTSIVVGFSCPNRIGLGGNCVDANGFRDTADNTENFGNLVDPIEKVDASGASVHLVWDNGGVSFTSITAYETNEFQRQEDSDASPASNFHFNQDSEADQVSQEFRLASPDDQSFRWIAGAFGFWEDTRGDTGPIQTQGAMAMVNMTRLEQDSEVYSLYGEIESDFTERLTGVFGLRYTHDDRSGRNQTITRFCTQVCDSLTPEDGQDTMTFDTLVSIPATMGLNIDDPLSESWDQWGGKIGLEYVATDDTLLYGHISRGFKGGNFSAAPLQAIAGTHTTPVDPEIVIAYEMGVKSTLMDGAMTANFAVFFNDYTDQQVLRLTNSPGFGLAAALVNIEGSEIFGIEFDSQISPGNGWFLDFSLGLMDTEIVEFIDDSGSNFAGNQLTNAPRVTANARISKDIELDGGNLLSFSVDSRYASERQFDLSNDPLLADDSYTLLNAQVNWHFGQDRQYRLTAWGRNLTDELYFQNKSDFSSRGFIQSIVNAPPMYGLTFNLNFD